MFKFGFKFIKHILFYHNMVSLFHRPPRLILPEAALPTIIAEVLVLLQLHAPCIRMPHLALSIFANVLHPWSTAPRSVYISSATYAWVRRHARILRF